MTTVGRPTGHSPNVVALVFSPKPSLHTATAASAVLHGVETKGGTTAIQHIHNLRTKFVSCSKDHLAFGHRVNPSRVHPEGQTHTHKTSRLVDPDS